jgi:hypothetical protein
MFSNKHTPTKSADPLGEMKAAINKATNDAENAGVFARAVCQYFEGAVIYWRQRAMHQSDLANMPRPEHVAAVALIQEKRREAERLASERDWQASGDRRAEERAERDSYR